MALKDQKARYEKADEILGKILLIMLYDIGIRTSAPQLNALKARMTDIESAAPTLSPSLNSVGNTGETTDPDLSVGTSGKAASTSNWKGETVKITEITSETEAFELLKKVEIPDFFSELKGGGRMSSSQFELLRGSFYGDVIFDDPNSKPWQVKMKFDGSLQSGKYEGTHEISLVNAEGKRFSHTTGKISDENYMSINGDPNGILINAYGDDGFFQLYFFPRLNQFFGIVYLKETIGKFKRQGLVRLSKR